MTSSNILSTLKSISDYLYPFKPNPKSLTEKRQKHNSLRELYKPRQEKPQDPEIISKMTDWLSKLDKKSLNRILTHKNLFMSTFTKEAFFLLSKEGNSFFKLKSAQPKLELHQSVFYCIETQRKTMSDLDSPLNSIDKSFEGHLRYCDQDAYCDCLSLDPSIDGSQFLAFAKSLTENKAFCVPCKVSCESNTWIWDYPAWFVPGQNYTLASFVLASFERVVWMHFWAFHNLDPRTGSESQVYKKESETGMLCTNELGQFLDSLSVEKRKEVIGDREKHLEISQKAEIEDLQSKTKKTNTDSGLVLLGNKGNKVEGISEKFEVLSSVAFLEFLYYTPLDRIATGVDLVAKKVLLSVASAMSDKKAEDLMKEPEKLQKKFNRNKKAKKSRFAKEKKKNTVDVYRSIAEDILNNVISELEENPEFQVKKPQPSRTCFLFKTDPLQPKIEEPKSAQPQAHFKPPYKKNYNRKSLKRPHSSQTKAPNSNQSTPKVQTSHTSTEVTPTKTESIQKSKWSKINQPVSSNLDTFDFPPLINSEPVKFSNLHHEISKFCANVSKKVAQKFEKFRPSLEKIYAIISEQHPNCTIFLFGSYGSSLAIESSDIDLLVTLPDLPGRREIKEFCLRLAEKLQTVSRSATAITTARIPLVKLETDEYCIDISFEDDEHSHLGLPTMNLVIHSTMTYSGLREMILLFKQLLQVHGLNCSFRGGLGAYSLFIWVLAYFRRCSQPELDLGLLAEGFLNYFVNGFDPLTTGLDLSQVCVQFPLGNLCFENVVTVDPITGNNVTAGLFQAKEIFGLFRECLGRIEEWKEKWSCRGMLRTIFKFS